MADPSGTSPLPQSPDRREFLTRSGSALGGAWILSMLPLLQACSDAAREAVDADAPLRFFSEEEYEAVEAMTARILPSDDTPGAREAGVARFMDQAFADQLLPGLDAPIRGAIQMANGMASGQGSASGFAGLDEAAQDGIIAAMYEDQSSPYFPFFLATMMGFLANPEYGGNRDEVGWRLMGFERATSFDPPFGHYDRLYREGGLG